VSNSRLASLFVVVLVLLGAWAWLNRLVTIQGEATIYTAACSNGQWNGHLCTGRLAPADRYRFRALPRRQEVLFWTLGKPEPSGRFSRCLIQDGRNWVCPPSTDVGRTITLSLVRGRAVHDPSGQARAFRAIAKWRWLLLKWGVSTGRQADY